MARPAKPGLDYFPLDVDFFSDPKLEFVAIACGELGELVAIKLLCLIYKEEGYYIPWDEDRAALFSKKAGKNVSPALVNDVVKELLKRGFFNKEMYTQHGILTSNGLQKRYAKINKDARRKFKIKDEHNVMEPDEDEEKKITAEETPIIPEETPVFSRDKYTNKSKENKIKEDENKVNHTMPYVAEGAAQGKAHVTKKDEDDVLAAWVKLVKQLPTNTNDKKQALRNFITAERPVFIEPYASLWNIFAAENNLAQVQTPNP